MSPSSEFLAIQTLNLPASALYYLSIVQNFRSFEFKTNETLFDYPGERVTLAKSFSSFTGLV